jgi:hypothetical protein
VLLPQRPQRLLISLLDEGVTEDAVDLEVESIINAEEVSSPLRIVLRLVKMVQTLEVASIVLRIEVRSFRRLISNAG